MKREPFIERTRYDVDIKYSFDNENYCWLIDCTGCAYFRLIYDSINTEQIVGIDPEGYYIIEIGQKIKDDTITNVELVNNTIKAYI